MCPNIQYGQCNKTSDQSALRCVENVVFVEHIERISETVTMPIIHSNYMWFFFPWCASYFFKIVYFLPQIILKCMHAPEMIKIQLHIRLCSCGHVYARNKSRVLQRAHDVVILHTASSSMPLYERTKGMPPPFYEVYMRRQTESKTDEHVDS